MKAHIMIVYCDKPRMVLQAKLYYHTTYGSITSETKSLISRLIFPYVSFKIFTREHEYKLFKEYSRLLCRSNYFINRIANDWNSLSEYVVNSSSFTYIAIKINIEKFFFVIYVTLIMPLSI